MPEDRATSGQAPPAPQQQGGQAGRTSQGRQPGRTEQDAGRQESQAPAREETGKDKPGKVNLYDLPEFKNYQRQVQQTIEKERTARTNAEQRAQELAEASMSDYEKAEARAARAEEQLQSVLQEKQQQEEYLKLQKQIQGDKQRLNQRFGIPIEELDQAESYEQAEEMAIDWLKKSLQGEGASAEDSKAAQRKAANRPNLGVGSREVSRNVDELRKAWESGDGAEYVGSLLRARKDQK